MIDSASSGRWFRGWKHGYSPPPAGQNQEVCEAGTWLLRVGWRRHGLIDRTEVPDYEVAV